MVSVISDLFAYLCVHTKYEFTYFSWLLLTDLKMPEMDGYDLLNALRSNPETQLTPFILLAAKVDEDASIKSL